jgi:hypothetical protein
LQHDCLGGVVLERALERLVDHLERGEVMRTAVLRSQMVQAHVRCDPSDPGPHLVTTVEATESLVDAQEYLLGGFLDVLGIHEHAATDPVHAGHIAPIDLVVRGRIALLEGDDQILVF